MPNAQNKEMLASIKEDLDGGSAMWVVDYRGLTVKGDAAAAPRHSRDRLGDEGPTRTLVHMALAEAELPTLDDHARRPERVRVLRQRRGRIG